MSGTVGIVQLSRGAQPRIESAIARRVASSKVITSAVLHGMSDAQLLALHDPDGEYPIFMGGVVTSCPGLSIPLTTLVPMIPRAIEDLESRGADVIILACAAGFPSFETPLPIVTTGSLLPDLIRRTTSFRRVGVIVPNPGQVKYAEAKWRQDGFEPIVKCLEPPVGGTTMSDWEPVCSALLGDGIDALVIDCFGFDAADGGLARQALAGANVFVALDIAGSVAAGIAATA